MFLGRTDEQRRFETALAETITGRPGPGPSQVLLVHGLGGIGKTALCERFDEIARGTLEAAKSNEGEFLVATVNWQDERDKRPPDFPGLTGPQPLTVFTAMHDAVIESLTINPDKRLAKKVNRAFEGFLEVVAQMPAVQERDARIAEAMSQGESLSEALAKTAAQFGGRFSPVPVTPEDVDTVARALKAFKRHADSAKVGSAEIMVKLRPEEALTRELAAGLRKLGEERPLVFILDTYEVVRSCGGWLRNLMSQTGEQVLWVVAARLEPEAEAGRYGELASFRRELPEDKLTVISIANFGHESITELLKAEQVPAVDEGMVDTITSLTHGLPLAVNIVAQLLLGGESLDEITRAVTVAGDGSQIVRELTERYLLHARKDPELIKDVPLLYGLALLYADRADAEMIRELWGIDSSEVGQTLDDLAVRYEFVLTGRRRLHQEVRDTFRRYLLDSMRREEQRPANERAAALALQRTTARGKGLGTIERLASEDWRSSVATFIWHSFWVGNRTGLDLLCEVFPAAVVLDRAFAHELVGLASFFSDSFSREQRSLLRGLASLLSFGSFVDGWLAKRRLAFHRGERLGSAREEASDLDRRLALQEVGASNGGALLMPQDSDREVLVALLRAKSSTRTEPEQALAALQTAAEFVNDGPLTGQMAETARELARSLILAAPDGEPGVRMQKMGVSAAKLAARFDAGSPSSWFELAAAQKVAGELREALAAYEEVIRRFDHLDERSDKELLRDLARAHFQKGLTFGDLGQREEEIEAYRSLVQRFQALEDPAIRHVVGDSLLAHALALSKLGRSEEEIEIYDQILDRMRDDEEPRLRLLCARALFNKAVTQSPSEERLRTLEEFFERYAESKEVELRRLVAEALFIKGATLGELGWSKAEEIEAYDQAIDYVGDSEDAGLLKALGDALYGKGMAVEDPVEAIGLFDQAIARLSHLEDPTVRAVLAEIMRRKGGAYGELKETEAMLAVFDQIVERFLDDETPAIRLIVANALWTKGGALDELKRYEEEKDAYRLLLDRFGSDPNPEVQVIVATVMFNLIVILNTGGSQQEAIGALRRLQEQFRDNQEAPIRRILANAFLAQAKAFEKADKVEEAIEILRDQVALLANDEDLQVRREVALGLMRRARLLSELERYPEEIESLAEIDSLFGGDEDEELRRTHAISLFHRAYRVSALGRPDEALAICKRAVDLYGTDPDERVREALRKTLLERNRLLHLLERYEEELSSLDETLQHIQMDEEPELEVRALRTKASALAKLGREPEAIEALDEAFERLASEDAKARLQAAQAGLAAALLRGGAEGFGAQAAALGDLIDRLAPDEGIPDDFVPELRFRRGVTLTEAGRYEEALAVYDELIESAWNGSEKARLLTASGLHNRAGVLSILKRPEDGLASLARLDEFTLDEFTDDDGDLKRLLAQRPLSEAKIFNVLGRYEEELQCYEQFLEAGEGMLTPFAIAEARFRAGLALAKVDRPGAPLEAAANLHKLGSELARETDDSMLQLGAEAFRATAIEYRRQGELGRSCEVFEEMLRLFAAVKDTVRRSLVEARFGLAISLGAMERRAEEIAQMKAVAEEVDEEDRVELQRLAASALYTVGLGQAKLAEPDEALGRYRAAIERFGSSEDAELRMVTLRSYAGCALVLQERGELEEAEQAFAEAIRMLSTKAERATVYGDYALFLTDYKGDHDGATKAFEEALAAEPDNANNLGNLARLLFEQGELDRAIKLTEEAKGKSKENEAPLRLELAFYLFAFGAKRQAAEAAEEAQTLLRQGVRSPDWNLQRIINRAAAEKRPHLPQLEAMAPVIAGKAPIESLEERGT